MFRSASVFIDTSFTVAVFTIFATSNVDSIVSIPHKIYSIQRILIHTKADLFVKCAHLHPGYAANLVARIRYYHCQWTVLVTYIHTNLVDSAWARARARTLYRKEAGCVPQPRPRFEPRHLRDMSSTHKLTELSIENQTRLELERPSI